MQKDIYYCCFSIQDDKKDVQKTIYKRYYTAIVEREG